MKKLSTIILTFALCSSAFADVVQDAYQEAYASAQSTLALHKQCEDSIKREDMEPCREAQSSYNEFKAKSGAFLASVKPEELFQHVTPKQMSDITSLNNQIGESMDSITSYLSKRKK
ncbi:hypothetical protein D3C81_344750 [compost metagenome]